MRVNRITFEEVYDPAVVTKRAELVFSRPLGLELTERIIQVGKRVFYGGLVFATAVIASRLAVGSVVLLYFPYAVGAATSLVVIGIALALIGQFIIKKKEEAALVDLLKTWNQTLVYDKMTLAEWLVLINKNALKLHELLDHITASPFVEQFDQAMIYLQRYVRFDDIAEAILKQPVVQDNSGYRKRSFLENDTSPKALFNILEDLRKNNKLTKEQKEEIITFALSLNRK